MIIWAGPTMITQGGDPMIKTLKTVRVLVLSVCTGLGLRNRAAKPVLRVGHQAPAQGFLGVSEGRGRGEVLPAVLAIL